MTGVQTCSLPISAESEVCQVQRDLNRLVELGKLHFLQQRHRFIQEVLLLLHRSARLGNVLSCFATHLLFSSSPTAPRYHCGPWFIRFVQLSCYFNAHTARSALHA